MGLEKACSPRSQGHCPGLPFLGPGRGVKLLGAESGCFSVLIDGLGLCKLLLTVPILSHNASDCNHMHAQSCIGIRANREFLLKGSLRGYNLSFCTCTQNQPMGGCLTVPTFGMCLAMREESLKVARDLEAGVSCRLCREGCVQIDVGGILHC